MYLSPTKIQVRIANPARGGRKFTSLARAREYEASGAGRFWNGQFVFHRGDAEDRMVSRVFGDIARDRSKARRLRPCDPGPDKHQAFSPWPDTVARSMSGSRGGRIIAAAEAAL